MFNRKLKERVKELEADLKCEKAQHEHAKQKYNKLLNIKEDKTFGILYDYLESRWLDLNEGNLCYIVCKEDTSPLKYSPVGIRYINYYTGIYKLKDELFILCESLVGDFSEELDSKGVKSYEQLFKEAEENDKSNRLEEIIRKCLDV